MATVGSFTSIQMYPPHTHTIVTYNSNTRHCHTHFFPIRNPHHYHKQLDHTPLSHTTLTPPLSHTTLSHAILPTHFFRISQHFHTQHCHTQPCHTAALCVASVALGDIDVSVWQVWHLLHWAGSGGALGCQ